MNDISDEFKKRLQMKKEGLEVNSNPLSLFESISEEIKTETENNPILKFKKNLSETNKKVKENLDVVNLFEEIFKSIPEETIIQPEIISEEVLFAPIEIKPKIDIIQDAASYITKEESLKDKKDVIENYTNFFGQPNSKKPEPTIKEVQNKVKYLEDWLTKVSLHGPGSGEVELLRLDDVDTSNLQDKFYLRYDLPTKKLVFENPNANSGIETLDSVTTRGNSTNNSITVNRTAFLNGTSIGGDSDSNINVVGNLIPVDNVSWSLGSSTEYWNAAYIGPQSLNIMPEVGSNVVIKLENVNETLFVRSGGFAVYDPSATYNTFYVANSGYASFHTPSPLVGQAVLNISASPSSNVIPVANTQTGGVLHLTGADSGATIITVDNFDNSAPSVAAGVIAFRRFRGSVDSPQPVKSGDALGGVVALGSYGNTINPLPVSTTSGTYGRIQFIATEDFTSANNGQKIIFNSVPVGSNVAQTTLIINAGGSRGGIQLPYTNTGITFSDNTFQNTAFRTANSTTIGGVRPDNTTITINDGILTCVGTANNGTGTDYIEVYDRANIVSLNSTPILLKPSSLNANVGIRYDSSTGVFTFPNAGNYGLSLVVNARSDIAGATLYIYAEQNTGSGWTVNQNSGKQFELINNQTTQIVYSQSVHRTTGQQIRYWIFTTDTDSKTYLQTTVLPGISPTVYVPAIRIQYS